MATSPHLYLGAAILAEVTATSALKSADGFTRLWPSLIVVAGCWISGLPVSSVLFGVVVALVLFLAAMILAWSIRRSRQPGGFVSAPFVTAALGGLAASLLYGSIWH